MVPRFAHVWDAGNGTTAVVLIDSLWLQVRLCTTIGRRYPVGARGSIPSASQLLANVERLTAQCAGTSIRQRYRQSAAMRPRPQEAGWKLMGTR